MNTRHLKIPVNFDRVPYEHRNLYVAFLWVQQYSPFGRVKISNIPKRQFHHWINKLIGAGWMRKEGNYYVLIGNERVWELLKIKKVNFKKRHTYYFRKLPKNIETWPEFKRKIVDDIQGWQTECKKRQLLRRHKYSDANATKTSLLSSMSVAKLFGYRSNVTGSKYRDKYFDVVQEPVRIREYFTIDGLPYWKADCKRIVLTKVYH